MARLGALDADATGDDPFDAMIQLNMASGADDAQMSRWRCRQVVGKLRPQHWSAFEDEPQQTACVAPSVRSQELEGAPADGVATIEALELPLEGDDGVATMLERLRSSLLDQRDRRSAERGQWAASQCAGRQEALNDDCDKCSRSWTSRRGHRLAPRTSSCRRTRTCASPTGRS